MRLRKSVQEWPNFNAWDECLLKGIGCAGLRDLCVRMPRLSLRARIVGNNIMSASAIIRYAGSTGAKNIAYDDVIVCSVFEEDRSHQSRCRSKVIAESCALYGYTAAIGRPISRPRVHAIAFAATSPAIVNKRTDDLQSGDASRECNCPQTSQPCRRRIWRCWHLGFHVAWYTQVLQD